MWLLILSLNCSVGRPKHVRVMAGALEGDLFIGPKAEVVVSMFSVFYVK